MNRSTAAVARVAGNSSSKLAELPWRQREALVFTVVAGYSMAEAGEVMGCAAGTVKTLCAQARQRLRADDDQAVDAAGSMRQGGDGG